MAYPSDANDKRMINNQSFTRQTLNKALPETETKILTNKIIYINYPIPKDK